MHKQNLFLKLSTCTLSDVLTRDRVMNSGIRPLWAEMPRVAGPAFTVRCPHGDNLMLHTAIYQASPGSIIVVESADLDYAVAGGNVCAVAQKRGIAGFIIDGAIRDLGEIRALRFPVFARGVIPFPGKKTKIDTLNARVTCGGVLTNPGDMIVADEEGVVVVPVEEIQLVLKNAQARAEKEASETLETWEAHHRAKIEEILKKI